MDKKTMIIIGVVVSVSIITIIIVKSKKSVKNIGDKPQPKSQKRIKLENDIKKLISENSLIDNTQLYRFSLDGQELDSIFLKIVDEDLKSLKYIIDKYLNEGVVNDKIDNDFLKKLADSLNLHMELS